MATTEITTHTFGEITLRGFVDDKGNPFFVAADLANALEYHDTFNMTCMLYEDEFGYPHIVRVSSSNQHGEFDRDVEMTMVTLSGVFHGNIPQDSRFLPFSREPYLVRVLDKKSLHRYARRCNHSP